MSDIRDYAKELNIELRRGNTGVYTLIMTDSSTSPTTYVDLTGATVYFTVKADKDDLDASAVIQKIVTTHSDPTNGETTITIDSADTTGISMPTDSDTVDYYYDIQVTLASGTVYTPYYGTFTLLKDTTHS